MSGRSSQYDSSWCQGVSTVLPPSLLISMSKSKSMSGPSRLLARLTTALCRIELWVTVSGVWPGLRYNEGHITWHKVQEVGNRE